MTISVLGFSRTTHLLLACCTIILMNRCALLAQGDPAIEFPTLKGDTIVLAYHDFSEHYDSSYNIPLIVRPAGAKLTVTAYINHTVTLAENGVGSIFITPQSAITTRFIFELTHNGRSRKRGIWFVSYINLDDIKPTGTWPARKATIGTRYNPSSNWYHEPKVDHGDTYIPWDHAPENFQTVVEFNGRIVFDQPGAVFPDSTLPAGLMVTDAVKKIRTTVYYRPGKTRNRKHWQLMVAARERKASEPDAYPLITIITPR
jgi:hypothetical protein